MPGGVLLNKKPGPDVFANPTQYFSFLLILVEDNYVRICYTVVLLLDVFCQFMTSDAATLMTSVAILTMIS